MGYTCILTDSAAQFPQLGFPGRNDIHVIPYSVEVNELFYDEGKDLRPGDLPATASAALRPRLIAPTVEQFQAMFANLGQQYSDIITILTSSCLTQSFENAQKAASGIRGRIRITLIDSQTISVGLGLLVQSAAEAVSKGLKLAEIERLIRSQIPHTYVMFCTPGMSYLYHAGLVDESQAFVSEMLGMMPIFTLEEGQLSSVEKVKNSRGLVDFMQEFVLEFEDVQHIAFLQSSPGLAHESKAMREHVQNFFPQIPFSELTVNLPLATLIGPRSVGMVVVEKAGI